MVCAMALFVCDRQIVAAGLPFVDCLVESALLFMEADQYAQGKHARQLLGLGTPTLSKCIAAFDIYNRVVETNQPGKPWLYLSATGQ